jgi:hypothetical protein
VQKCTALAHAAGGARGPARPPCDSFGIDRGGECGSSNTPLDRWQPCGASSPPRGTARGPVDARLCVQRKVSQDSVGGGCEAATATSCGRGKCVRWTPVSTSSTGSSRCAAPSHAATDSGHTRSECTDITGRSPKIIKLCQMNERCHARITCTCAMECKGRKGGSGVILQ